MLNKRHKANPASPIALAMGGRRMAPEDLAGILGCSETHARGIALGLIIPRPRERALIAHLLGVREGMIFPQAHLKGGVPC